VSIDVECKITISV